MCLADFSEVITHKNLKIETCLLQWGMIFLKILQTKAHALIQEWKS